MPDFPTQELALVARVRGLLRPYLEPFAAMSSVPESFWGALSVNESGIYIWPNETGLLKNIPPRFEPNIFKRIKAVAEGEPAEYAGVTQTDLAGTDASYWRDLSSSWGPTQIMGYHAVRLNESLWNLRQPSTHYPIAAKIMAEFTDRFNLDPTKQFEEMFRVWNVGVPHGRETFDPNYISNGIMRMQIWQALSDLENAKSAP